MTLFTDNPFEKMMIQRPGGRRDNAPPVPHSPACASCPYKGQLPCVGYCLKQVQEKKASEPERLALRKTGRIYRGRRHLFMVRRAFGAWG